MEIILLLVITCLLTYIAFFTSDKRRSREIKRVQKIFNHTRPEPSYFKINDTRNETHPDEMVTYEYANGKKGLSHRKLATMIYNMERENKTGKLSTISEFDLRTAQNGDEHVNNHKIFILNNDMSYDDLMRLLKKYNTTFNKIWTSENVKGFLERICSSESIKNILSENPVQLKKDESKYLIHRVDKDGIESINSLRFKINSNEWVDEVENHEQIFPKGTYFISRGEQQMEMN